MNRVILGITDDLTKVDHINHDTLDNRKANLRPATQGENLCNRGKQTNNRSGYKGVSWCEDHHKYRVTITRNAHTTFLGYTSTAEEGAGLYSAAAKEIHKEFAFCG